MSAATILEGQAHAHLLNAMHGYSAQQQLALAEQSIKELHARLLADEHAAAAYAAVARRPVLVELAGMRPEIGLPVRDMYDGVTDLETLAYYRAEALRRASEFVSEVEHIDRRIAAAQGSPAGTGGA